MAMSRMSRSTGERGPRGLGHGRRLHGRRTAHRLRPSQQRAMETLLPRLQVTLPPEGALLDPAALFEETPRALWLEIGFGAGEHLVWQAQRNPDIGFLGAEVFHDGIAKMLRHVEEEQLTNVRVFTDDARELLECLPDASLDRAFLLFPDPWPKLRHHKRRFVQPEQLDAVARVLRDGGEFRLATDDPGYQRWMLIQLMRHPAFEWTAERPGDWRERPKDWPATRYELKALGQGRQPVYLRFRRRARQDETSSRG